MKRQDEKLKRKVICQAIKINGKQCSRLSLPNKKYCWQHIYSRKNAPWYYNNFIQVIFLVGACCSIVGIVLLKSSETNVTLYGDQPVVHTGKGSINIHYVPKDSENDKYLKSLETQVSLLQERYKITNSVINNFFEKLNYSNIPFEDWKDELDKFVRSYNEILDQFNQLTSTDPKIVHLQNAARQAIEIGDLESAEMLLDEAFNIDIAAIKKQQKNADERKMSAAETLHAHALLVSTQRKYSESINLFKKAIETLPENEKDRRAAYLNDLGVRYVYLENIDDALMVLTKSVELNRQVNNQRNLAVSLGNLGAAYFKIGKLHEAEVFLNESYSIFKDLEIKGDLEIKDRVAGVCHNLGFLCLQLENNEKANKYWEEAKEYYMELGDSSMAKQIQGWIDSDEEKDFARKILYVDQFRVRGYMQNKIEGKQAEPTGNSN